MNSVFHNSSGNYGELINNSNTSNSVFYSGFECKEYWLLIFESEEYSLISHTFLYSCVSCIEVLA
jgi:hypothetical protein